MKHAPTHADALSALGHDARLQVFRLLVQAGPDGLSVGDIIAHTGLAASTLAHHLSTLVDAGLVRQERRGRIVQSIAEVAALRRTVDFLLSECCTGLCTTLAGDAA